MASLTYLVAGSRSAGAAGMDGMALVFIIQLDSPEPSNYDSHRVPKRQVKPNIQTLQALFKPLPLARLLMS